jgi:hypothetical protein
MIVFGVAGLSVLAGTGAELLSSWLRRYHKFVGQLVALIALALVVVEYWNPPGSALALFRESGGADPDPGRAGGFRGA